MGEDIADGLPWPKGPKEYVFEGPAPLASRGPLLPVDLETMMAYRYGLYLHQDGAVDMSVSGDVKWFAGTVPVFSTDSFTSIDFILSQVCKLNHQRRKSMLPFSGRAEDINEVTRLFGRVNDALLAGDPERVLGIFEDYLRAVGIPT